MERKSIVRKFIVVAGCAALAVAGSAGLTYAATATANASGIVVKPLQITKTLDMNFGKFMPSGTGGTVVVSTANAQSTTGGVSTTTGLGTSAKAATFTVAGEPDSTYAITFPTTAKLSGAGTDMAIGTFTGAVDTGSIAGTVGTLPGAPGSHVLSVGATLTVAGDQTPGSYTGTIDIAVNYN